MNNTEKKLPLVTVGITSFERPFTLKQALQSVIKQTYQNLEIYIVDDSSTTFDVANFFQAFTEFEPRLNLITKKSNTGLTESVNAVAKIAKGKYYLWLCDDDWIDEDYIEKCVDFIEKHSDYSLVTGTTKFYFNENFIYEPEKINVESENKIKRFISFHNQCLGTANCPDFGLIRTELLKKTPLKNILGHDNILIGNLAISGKIKTLNNTYLNRRLGGCSETLKKCAILNSYSLYEKITPFVALYTNIVLDIFTYKSSYNPYNILLRIYTFLMFTFSLMVNIFEKYFTYKKRDTKNLAKLETDKIILQTGLIHH